MPDVNDEALATAIIDAPPADVLAVVRRHYAQQREDLLQRVRDLEDFLGFVDVSGDLAVRVGKLEHFTGVNR